MDLGSLDIPKCEICIRHYCEMDDDSTAPFSIGCGHTVCRQCVERLKKEWLKCPFCRKPIYVNNVQRNYSLEDAVKIIMQLIKRETSLKKEIDSLKVGRLEKIREIESLNSAENFMRLQLKLAKENLDNVEFENEIEKLVRFEYSTETPNLNNIHNEARRWLQLKNDDVRGSDNIKAKIRQLRTDYLVKLRKRMTFDDPVNGKLRMGRAEMTRINQYLSRMTYRQLLTYMIPGEMNQEQQASMLAFFSNLAETITIQNSFNSIADSQ